jgi:flagellar protein FlbD
LLLVGHKSWKEKKKKKMIEVTKLNGNKITINADLIEIVEETPDTVITLTTGRKIIVKESRQDVKNLVKSYRKNIFAEELQKNQVE